MSLELSHGVDVIGVDWLLLVPRYLELVGNWKPSEAVSRWAFGAGAGSTGNQDSRGPEGLIRPLGPELDGSPYCASVTINSTPHSVQP